jgi:phage terminase large subunit-like protein
MGEDIMEMIQLVEALEDLQKYKDTHKLEYYEPYPFQKAFHHAKSGQLEMSPFDLKSGALAVQKALMAANQVGKTFSAACEITFHATGNYPDWWEGIRFEHPVQILVAGHRNESVRDVCQMELFGDPFNEQALGTGTVPIDCIGKVTRKAGVPNAYSAVMVKHITGGWSKVRLMAYEQGADAFMGIKFDVGWGDEEPPIEIWTQMIRSTFSRKKYILMLTFTPENGVTNVVDQFMNHLKDGQSLIRATWDDAKHMTKEKRKAYLEQLPERERDMRTRGIPLMGSGLIYPINDENISVDPFNIPDHWSRVCGVDFGVDHPFAAVWLAHDRDTDTIYVYDCYRESGQTIATHTSAVNRRGNWIPVIWPHDGLKRDTRSGVPLADIYRQEGMNMWVDKFSNPPSPGQKEGQGGQGVEVGITEIYNRMEAGSFKVFSSLSEWFEEKNQYHRKDGKRVELRDDLMDATRYASMSLRFARTKPIVRKRQSTFQGITNW